MIASSQLLRFCIIAPAWVGDLVMAQSLFKFIKQTYPNSMIDAVAPPSTAPLLARMPEIRKSFQLNSGHGALNLKTRWQLAQQLRAEKYDEAIVLPNSFKSALIPFFADISKRTGFLGEMRVMLLNNWQRLNKKKYPRLIDRFAALVTPNFVPSDLPFPFLSVDENNQKTISQKI